MRWRHWLAIACVVALVLTLSTGFPQSARAASIGSCAVTLTPHLVAPGSQTDFQVSITNDDANNNVQWLQILRPSEDFTIVSVSAPDTSWSAEVSSEQVILTDDGLSPGDTLELTLRAQAANTESPAASWSVFASGNLDGSDSTWCENDAATEISNGQPLLISSVSVAAVTAHTATINWTTNRPANSQIDYGPTSSYDSTVTSDSFVTNHSLMITGLAASKAYHFRVMGETTGGSTAQSGDNTFITSVEPPVSSGGGISPGGNVPGVAIKPVPTEKVPPAITLSTSLARPFKQVPRITGRATDNEAVAKVEYSVDGGQNWVPADVVTAENSRRSAASFAFTPVLNEDGNYRIVARATDTSGNQASTQVATLVIDRLPPQMGPIVISYGPEILTPSPDGNFSLVAGSDYRFTTSMVGGPTKVVIEARTTNQGNVVDKTFTLEQAPDTGLWNGLFSFSTGGMYQLVAQSVDGAGNTTSRHIMTVVASAAGRVAERGSHKMLAGAQLTLYYREPSTRSWRVWDGAPYGQANPQHTKADGSYSLMLPAGTFYVRVQAPLHGAFVSDIFTVDRATPLTSLIALNKIPYLSLWRFKLHLPDIVWRSQPLPVTADRFRSDSTSTSVGATVPNFTLPTTAGGQLKAFQLTGKPTLITALATWSPSSQSQLGALAELQSNKDINITPVFSQERNQLVATYIKTAGYSLTGIIDTDGVLVPTLHINAVPQHFFVDRTGTIKKILNGVYTKEQLRDELGSL